MAQEIPEEFFFGKIAQKAIIEHGGKVLLCRTRNVKTWDLPGGRLHKGETPAEGLQREIREEIGVEVEVGEAIHTATFSMSMNGEPHFYIAHRACLKEFHQEFILAPDEIEEVQWVGKDEFESVDIWETCKESLRRYFR